jgi:hypothetical protein
VQFSPTSYRFIPPRSKYSPQHPVLKHPRPMLPLTRVFQISVNISVLETESDQWIFQ